jgi:hypothetical protein
MRIAFIIWDYWPDRQGGSERQCRLIARLLAARGHVCEVWTAWQDVSWPREETDEGTRIRRFGRLTPCLNRWQRRLEALHGVLRRRLAKSTAGTLRYDRWRRQIDFCAFCRWYGLRATRS